MASAAIEGRIGSLAVSSDGGSNYSVVGESQDCDLATTSDTHDATSKDSGRYREFKYGFATARITGRCLWVDDDAGQAKMLDALEAQTTLKARFRLQTATGKDQWNNVDALVASCGPGDPLDGLATLAFELQLSGSFARANQ